MRIHLIREGGFTGIPVEVSVDEAELDSSEAAELRSALSSADFFNLPRRLAGDPNAADTFNYTLQVDEGSRSHTVFMAESAVPDPLAGLIQRMVRRGRGQ